MIAIFPDAASGVRGGVFCDLYLDFAIQLLRTSAKGIAGADEELQSDQGWIFFVEKIRVQQSAGKLRAALHGLGARPRPPPCDTVVTPDGQTRREVSRWPAHSSSAPNTQQRLRFQGETDAGAASSHRRGEAPPPLKSDRKKVADSA